MPVQTRGSEETLEVTKMMRRSFLQGVAAAASALPLMESTAQAQSNPPGRKLLLKGGYVVSCDKSIGEFKSGDVLVNGAKIENVGVDLPSGDAEVIDATNKLVLPGLIDTHRHTWETQLRSMIPEGDFFVYLKVILQTVAPRYRPDDVYIGNLFGALGAINSGITTMLDWSHIMLTPEHADAAVKGLTDSGIRGVFAHGDPVTPFADWWNPKSELRHPADARRVRRQYFNSDDQLLTMALALRGPEYSSWDASVDDLKLARDLGLPITIHMGVPGAKPGAVKALYEAKLLGPDITHVHTLRCSDEELQMIGDSGGSVSTSSATELMSGHGFPSLQRWLRHGIRPALSIDNETRMPTDLFTQMRALLMIDRVLETQRVIKEGGKPILVPVRDILDLATIQGARTLGLDRKTGTLTPGKQADVIMINLDDINVMPVNDAVSSAVTICNPSNVSWVMIDGKVRKRDGKLVGVDIERSRQLMAQSHAFLTRGLDQGGGAKPN
jgi:cytosine/adenosine deaminase-related metal-dependent hydrolase